MKTAAIIPVRGRISLLAWTVSRLKDLNDIDHVILVGHEDEAYDLAKMMDVDWVHHPNFPLGMKYNAGWEYAWKKYNADYYMMMGSSDWFSPNWVDVMVSDMGKADFVVKRDKYYLNMGRYGNRMVYWKNKGGYASSGMIVGKRMMDMLNGRPFNDVMDNDLDWSIVDNIKSVKGKMSICDNKEAKSLSISYHKWSNAYSFDGYWNNQALCDQMSDGKDFLRANFMDALDMTLW